jgi:hypothetical protein
LVKQPAVTVIGLSGPDGSGKSTLLGVTADVAGRRGLAVRTTYLYGCLLCRNVRLPGALRSAGASPGTLALQRADGPVGTARRHLVHAGIDTAELALRLALERRRAAREGHARRTDVLVLTDRTPLDALVKHEPPVRGLTARWLRRLSRRYSAIVLLDARSESLARRDGEHSAGGLEHARSGYRRWSALIDRVVPVSTEQLSPLEAAAVVLDAAAGGDGRAAQGSSTGSGPPMSSE